MATSSTARAWVLLLPLLWTSPGPLPRPQVPTAPAPAPLPGPVQRHAPDLAPHTQDPKPPPRTKDRRTREQLKLVVNGGPWKRSVDVLFVGDGYTRHQAATFWRDVDRYQARFLKEPPFSWYPKRFNIHGLFVPSRDEGCDMSLARNRKRTVLESYFDSPVGRLLQFRDHRELTRQVKLVQDVDIVFVMVNIKKYGGSGSLLRQVQKRGRPLPAPTFAANDTTSFRIAVHELGHSFANLADEYVDKAAAKVYRLPRKQQDLEQPNVTLHGHFDPKSFETLKKTVKWRHLLELPGADQHPWLHEGAFYRATNVYRPWPRCMMRKQADKFCPVCMEAMAKAIVQACGDTWDGKAYHKAHPLSHW